MTCLNPNDPKVLEAQDKLSMNMIAIRAAVMVYSNKYKTEDFPPIVREAFVPKSSNLLSVARSPLLSKENVKIVSDFFDTKFTKDNITSLGLLYERYRGTLTESSPLLDNTDLVNFNTWLIEENTSKALELTGLSIDTNNELRYDENFFVSYYSNHTNPDIARSAREIGRLFTIFSVSPNMKFVEGNFKTEEGLQKIRLAERTKDIQVLDNNNLPKIYNSINGLYTITTNGNKVYLFPTALSLLDPGLHNDLFGTVISDFLKGTNNGDIITYFNNYFSKVLAPNLRGQIKEIRDNKSNEILNSNPTISGNELKSLVDTALGSNTAYLDLVRKRTLIESFEDIPFVTNKLNTLFINRVKDIGIEVDENLQFTDNYGNEVDSEDQIELGTIVAGDQFDLRGDEVNPTTLVASRIKKLFLAIPKVDVETNTIIPSTHIKGLYQFEDPSIIETLVRMELVNTMKPLYSNYSGKYVDIDVPNTFDIMLEKLMDKMISNKDPRLSQVIANIENIINDTNLDESEIDDFKREFVSSFSLVAKDYLMSMLSETEVVSSIDNSMLDSETKAEKDRAYSSKALRLNINNYESLANTHSEVLSGLIDSIDPSLITRSSGVVTDVKLSKLNPLVDIIKNSKSRGTFNSINSRLMFRDGFKEVFNIELSDFEINSMWERVILLPIDKQLIYYRDSKGNSNQVPVSKVIVDYMNTKQPDVRKSITEDLVFKTRTQNLVKIIVDVLNESRKPKQSNIYVIGSKSYYGFSEPSLVDLILTDIKNGGTTELDKFEGLHNGVADYLTAMDGISKDGTGSSSSLLMDSRPVVSRERIGNIKVVDNTASKFGNEGAVAIKDNDFLDNLIITFLKFTNSTSSYYRNYQGSTTPYARLYDFQVAADGGSSITFSGLGMNSGLLTTATYFKANLAEGTIVKDPIRMDTFKKLKTNQILTKIDNDTKLLADYSEIKKMEESEIEAEILKLINASDNTLDFKGKDTEFKRNFLLRKYATDNLIEGYHYKTKSDNDITVLGNVLNYEDFERGTYYLGGHFNDIFDSMRTKDEEVFTYGIINYKNKYNPDLEYPDLSESTRIDLATMNSDLDYNGIFPKAFETRTLQVMSPLIDGIVDELVSKEFERIKQIPVWSTENGIVRYLHELPLDTISGVNKIAGKDRLLLTEAAWYNFIMSYTIYNAEFTDFFNGGFEKYKQKGRKLNYVDPAKRFPFPTKSTKRAVNNVNDSARTLTTLSGEKLDYDLNVSTSIAIFTDVEDVTSRSIKEIMKAAPGINSYLINVADAQSIASPEYHKAWKQSIKGGWTSTDERIHKELMDTDVVITKEHLDWLKEDGNYTAGGSFKPFAFGLNDTKRVYKQGEEGAFSANTPISLKTSIFFAYPAVVRGTAVEELLKAMENQGVDILAAKSAVKNTAPATTTIHKVKEVDGNMQYDGLRKFNDNPLESNDGSFRLNPFLIDTHTIGQQQDTPNKGVYEGDAGKQPLKNMLANLDLLSESADYFVASENKSFTGREIFDKITNTGKGLIQSQTDKFLGSLIREDGSIDNTKLRKLLIAQLDPLKDIEDIEILKDNDIPITTLLNSTQKLFPVLSKYIDKRVAQVNTNKASAVQVANIGFTEYYGEEKNDIIYTSENRELTPPKPITLNDLSKEQRDLLLVKEGSTLNDIVYYDSEGNPTLDEFNPDGTKNKMRIAKSKMLLPFKQLNLGMSYEQFKELYSKGKVDKELFKNILAYRIPNQAISSNDSSEIVGILPPTMGDAAIVYHEITTKTGSDFDVDKLYLMMPSFNIEKKVMLDKDLYSFISELKSKKITIDSKFNDFNINGKRTISELLKDPQLFKLFHDKGLATNGRIDTESPIKFIIDNSEDILDNISYPVPQVEIDGEQVYLDEIVESFVDNNIKFIENLRVAATRAKEEHKQLLEDSYRKYGVNTITNISYAKEGYKGEQNKFIEYYNAILESENTYEDLITPLDSDAVLGSDYYKNEIINKSLFNKYYFKLNEVLPDSLSKEDYDKAYNEFIESKLPSVLANFSPIERAISRDEMLKAKNLVAITANHMSDISYTQIFNQSIKHSILDFTNEYSKEELISLGNLYVTIGKDPIDIKGSSVRNRLKQTMLMSWIMNAAVDAAKDNYIIAGNFNSYTAPAAMFLTRVGLSPMQVFDILSSDTVLDITAANNKGFSKAADLINTDYSKETIQNKAIDLVHVMKDNNLKFLDVFNRENIYDREKEIASGFTMDDALTGLWGVIHATGKAHSATIKLGKPSSNGSGTNIGKHISLINNSDVVKLEDAFNNTVDKLAGFNTDDAPEVLFDQINVFHTSIPDNYTLEGATRNSGLMLTNYIGSNMFLELSKGYLNLVNDVSAVFGDTLSSKDERLSTISNNIYTYLVSKVIDPLSYYPNLSNTNEHMQKLKEHLFDKILVQRNIYKKQGVRFFNDLLFNRNTHSLFFAGAMNIDSTLMNSYKAELATIEESNPSLLTDIALFTLLESGFKPSITSLYSYLPSSTSIRLGIGNKLNNIRQAWSDGDYNSSFKLDGKDTSLDFDDLIKNIALMHPKDYNFTKKIYPNAIKEAVNINKKLTNTAGREIYNTTGRKDITSSKELLIPVGNDELRRFTKDGKVASVINMYYNKKDYIGYLIDKKTRDEIAIDYDNVLIYKFEELNKTNTTKLKKSKVDTNGAFYKRLTEKEDLKFNSLFTDLLDVVDSRTNVAERLVNNKNNDTFVIDNNITNNEAYLKYILDNNAKEDIANYLGISMNSLVNSSNEELLYMLKCK